MTTLLSPGVIPSEARDLWGNCKNIISQDALKRLYFQYMKNQPPKVIGHRGASGYAPENTLASFRKARELGLQWVEFDVVLCKTGEAILIHDHTVDRTTNSDGDVGELSYDIISKLDAGNWFSPEFAGEKIPRLRDAIPVLGELNLGANIELKPCPKRAVVTARTVVNILEECWPENLPQPIISSFVPEALKAVRKMNPDAQLGILMQKWRRDWQIFADEINAISIHVNQKVLDQEKVQAIKDSGRLAMAYTVNDAARAEELFSWGVDSVFSDVPDKI